MLRAPGRATPEQEETGTAGEATSPKYDQELTVNVRLHHDY